MKIRYILAVLSIMTKIDVFGTVKLRDGINKADSSRLNQIVQIHAGWNAPVHSNGDCPNEWQVIDDQFFSAIEHSRG